MISLCCLNDDKESTSSRTANREEKDGTGLVNTKTEGIPRHVGGHSVEAANSYAASHPRLTHNNRVRFGIAPSSAIFNLADT
jgi:hypothetical protein